MHLSNSYAKVDLDVLKDNLFAIAQKAGKPVMAVIKANAYGHGALAVAKALQEQCAFFGISSLAEALELRRGGITLPLLILGHTPKESFSLAVKEDIRPAIFCYEDALALSQAAQELGKTAAFHFAVDTGMSRIGFQVTEEDADLCSTIAALPGLYPEGLFSHFATADTTDLTRTNRQTELFAQFDAMLKDRGLQIPLRHLDNSAGIMHFGCHYEMVRSGIITYGLYPSDEMDPALLPVRPALEWFSSVVNLRQLPAGRQISYGGTFITKRETLVATVSTGYADGYSRRLSNRFHVLIRGKKAPILGRICMDQFMVDVTDIPNVQLGDEVVLLGRSGSETLSADHMAAALDTINYEIVCDISRRVPRVYYENGKQNRCINYLLESDIPLD